jgi:ParB/RepB/Spo0J family partition protein
MKVHISEIRKSPVNPKKDFTKKQLENLRESIKRYGFSSSIVVCHDFEKKSKYIVIDGNSRIDLLKEFEIEYVDVVINEHIKTRNDILNFIAIFDNIGKKYDFESLQNLQQSINDFSKKIINLKQYTKKYEVKTVENPVMYMITLPQGTVEILRRRMSEGVNKKQVLVDYINSVSDERILEIILKEYTEKRENKKKKGKK